MFNFLSQFVSTRKLLIVLSLVAVVGETVLPAKKVQAEATCFNEVVNLTPNNADNHYNLGFVLSNQSKLDAAIVEFGKAIGLYREVIRLNPNNAGNYCKLGTALYQQGFVLIQQNKTDEAAAGWAEAVRLYKEAIRVEPKNLILPQIIGTYLKNLDLIADIEYERGVELKKINALKEAITAWRRAVQINPNHKMAAALAKQGNKDEAVSVYRQAIRLFPTIADEFHVSLGLVLYQQDKLDEATSEFKEAVRINPKKALNHYFLGDILNRQGRLDEASTELREAIRINPKFAEAYQILGNVLNQQGRLDEATVQLKQARELFKQQGNNRASDELDDFLRRMQGLPTPVLQITFNLTWDYPLRQFLQS